jgi:acetate---CoA ligase (ADP-forming)
MPQDLRPLLAPRSIAIVGISQLPRFGGWLFENLRRIGYPGRIYGVNPRYAELHGQRCYASLADLPEVPECAILAVPNERLLQAVQQAAALGMPAAVISASAFSAPADGQPSLQDQIAETARQSGMVVCGPNGMGFIAPASRACATGYAIEPGMPAGNVAFISHSGTVFDTIWQNNRGLHFNFLVSSGNEIVTTMADYMQFALGQASTRAIGLFLETVRDPATFRAALAEAAERDVPVVALKVGRSAEGARLAQTHSGAVAGSDAVYDAIFAEYGVRRVRSLDEVLDTLELFAAGLRPATRFITAIHDSGGERGHLVDLAEAEAVAFAQLSAGTLDRLAGILEPGLLPGNPLDAWGTGNDIARIYTQSMLALDADPATGLNVWVGDLYAAGSISDTYVQSAIDHLAQFRNPLVFLPNVAASVSLAHAARLRAAGIPVLMGTENGLRALAHLLNYCEAQRARRAAAAVAYGPPAPSAEQAAEARRLLETASGPLDEHTSKQVLAAYGITCLPETVAGSLQEALEAAGRFGYPVAVKTAAGQLHKTDRGGVLLGISSDDALASAWQRLCEAFGPRVLVQPMAPPGVELVLGLIHDAQFGPMLALGLGGVFVEVFSDVRLLVLPTRPERVRAALHGLKCAPMLAGARGRPPANTEAVVEAALRLSALAADLGALIDSLDINPLLATPQGVLALDALIVPRHERPGSSLPLERRRDDFNRLPGWRPPWRPGDAVEAPLRLYECAVQPAWIDYNGHMTESAYLAAFGFASDALFRYVGIDEAYREAGLSFYTVETHINYYREASGGEPLSFSTQLLAIDEKRLHLFHSMHHGRSGQLLATTEQMLLHVDMRASATAPIPGRVHAALQAIVAAHQALPAPPQAGRKITLKKNG